jgi:hypoxanthine phosphoribosyltransferase
MTEATRPPWKGLRTDRMPGFISYGQIERMIGSMLDGVTAWQPGAVVAIVRGGLVPGTMVSCMLALPLFMAGWDRRTEITGWVGPSPGAKRLLLVDDCCATGRTMASVRSALRDQGHDCATLTIVHDPETTEYVPDFSQPMTELFRFPWERGEATPAARLLRATGGPADPAAERPFYGLDLDGVFLPDIARPDYVADLADALSRRHALALYPVLPSFPRDRAVVITGRPESDRALTQAWLARWGFADLRLECRPHDVPDDVSSVTRYKAVTATRWGCTHFIESDPEQAIRIAAAAPHLLVSWWSAAENRAWMIGAATQAGASIA